MHSISIGTFSLLSVILSYLLGAFCKLPCFRGLGESLLEISLNVVSVIHHTMRPGLSQSTVFNGPTGTVSWRPWISELYSTMHGLISRGNISIIASCVRYTESTRQRCRRHQHETTVGTRDPGPLKLVLDVLRIESSDAIDNQQSQF